MEGVELAERILTGPRGGNVENPDLKPEWRHQPLNAKKGESGPMLHRREDTTTSGIKDEQPWHRMAAYMLLAGRTSSEIAMAAGVTASYVSMVRSQRWFQELLAVLANEAGADITGMLQAEAQASLQKMIDVRDSSDDNVSVRLKYQAAKDLLELSHGKAVQKIVSNVSHTVYKDPQEEMVSIQNELKILRERNQPACLPIQNS